MQTQELNERRNLNRKRYESSNLKKNGIMIHELEF